ncbi:MAG: OmpA family protein [Candidatus Pedobacter colombiensis]|uniref:OmpA family protein n=1 Tax=Candidatus Pedobacter colombiensis TaxID=3121371 RepID=A0AAJ6B6A9_9SPHI|nr:OmpA family protein [Pedobacter sp.]WEK18271.1 MAG: OmpA family protein [Pedobacter sp.]
MKKSIYKLIIIVITLFISQTQVRAQYVLLEANKQFELYNFKKAIDLYEQAYQKKPTLHAAERLAQAYGYQSNYKQAESWYAIAVGMPSTPIENVLQYAKALQQNSKYAEAKEQYKKYIQLNKTVDAKQQNLWMLSCDSARYWLENPSRIVITNERTLNTPQSDWGATVYGQSIVFSSDRRSTLNDKASVNKPFLKFDHGKKPDRFIYGWTGNHYLKLYRKNQDSIFSFDLNVNTNYHVGPASFTKDGNEVFFTLTRIPKKPKYVKGKLATVNIEIYSSKKDAQGKWTNPVPFKYNKVDEYSVGDPFITEDGKQLYFVSNMPNGLGGTDIYVSERNDNGDWRLPRNLKEINTKGNERTPILDGDNNFYFSTDGRIGMGGLDIFKTQLLGGNTTEPKNLGYPTNSPQDDFAYLKTSELTGYFSSNRADGYGSDDIYSFTAEKILNFKLSGRVFDRKSNQPLMNTIVSLARNNSQILKVQTDETGNFRFNLDQNADYQLTGEKTNYRADVAILTTNNLAASTEIKKDLYLEKIELEKAIKIENIYYDFDQSNIRPDAAIELDKLVKILKDNPTIWIELGSHTDSRGNDQYNQWLSQRRANAAVQYIIDRGIDKNRITAKGYGEKILLNKCANGIKCSETDHQLNRRTEFKITKK